VIPFCPLSGAAAIWILLMMLGLSGGYAPELEPSPKHLGTTPTSGTPPSGCHGAAGTAHRPGKRRIPTAVYPALGAPSQRDIISVLVRVTRHWAAGFSIRYKPSPVFLDRSATSRAVADAVVALLAEPDSQV
jgi:hypothetical protein